MNRKIRALVVDDESLAREVLLLMLKHDREMEVIAECRNGREAVASIREHSPDVVFLDIQMPEVDGFQVIEEVGVEQMPVTVFVTAYDEFALGAFEVNAIDYLLKPFDEERLKKAVERAKREIRSIRPANDLESKFRRLLAEIHPKQNYPKRIPVKQKDGTILVSTTEIDWIAASGHYIELHTKRHTFLIREKISELESRLDPDRFVRIHRSAIVNIDRIKTLHPLFNGDHLIILEDGTELNLSRTYHERMIAVLTGK